MCTDAVRAGKIRKPVISQTFIEIITELFSKMSGVRFRSHSGVDFEDERRPLFFAHWQWGVGDSRDARVPACSFGYMIADTTTNNLPPRCTVKAAMIQFGETSRENAWLIRGNPGETYKATRLGSGYPPFLVLLVVLPRAPGGGAAV